MMRTVNSVESPEQHQQQPVSKGQKGEYVKIHIISTYLVPLIT